MPAFYKRRMIWGITRDEVREILEEIIKEQKEQSQINTAENTNEIQSKGEYKMYDNIWDLLNTCQDLLTVCQKLIIAERNTNKEEMRKLEDKISKLTADEPLKEFLEKC